MGSEPVETDYLVKPFAIDEFDCARKKCCAGARMTRGFRFCASGPLTMDLIERSVRRGDRQVDLLPREFNLLEYFMRHPNRS